MATKTTYEVRVLGQCIARRDSFRAALKEYEIKEAAPGKAAVELVRVTEETILSTSEKLSSERGYASKNG